MPTLSPIRTEAPVRPEPPAIAVRPPIVEAASIEIAGGNGASLKALEPLELETLMVNLDASLRVHARPHFFSWTQGLLQSLIRHEVLICALRDGDPGGMRADSFCMASQPAGKLTETFLQDASIVPGLIKAWEERRYRPLVCEASARDPLRSGNLARELEQCGATHLLAHGTHGADGGMRSLFILGCAADSIGPRQAYFAQLLVPFLHAAWLRVLSSGRAEGAEAIKPPVGSRITPREREILKWIYIGKSNIEIGAILAISPLTVKNHVQKILRKLDVLNRTQAVGKALALRILST